MSESVASSVAEYWATGFFILAVGALCAFMVGASSLLGGRSHGVSTVSYTHLTLPTKRIV